MKHRQMLFGVLTLAGLLVPGYHLLLYVCDNQGFHLGQFLAEANAGYVSRIISWDVTLSALVFLVWSNMEARRLNMKHWFVYPLLTCIALSFSLPLFLLMRERALARR